MMRLGDMAYALLLQAFPARFRRRHGAEMLAEFRRQRQALRGHPLATATLWIRAATDALKHGLALRFERQRPARTLVSSGTLAALVRDVERDTRYAWRRLRAAPVFTAFAVATLALGIGASTAVFAVVHAIVGLPTGVPRVNEIVNVYHGRPNDREGMSWPDFQEFRSRQTSFEAITGWSYFSAALAGNGTSRPSIAEVVDGRYFDVLGVRPALGRLLQPADDQPEAPLTTVISDSTWRTVYAGSSDVVGQVIRINGHAFQIVGVAPRAFRGLFNSGLVPTEAWVPIAAVRMLAGRGHRFTLDPEARENRWLKVKAVLAPGRTMAQAGTEVAAIARQLDESAPIGQTLPPRLRSPSNTMRPWILKPMSEIRVNESDARIIDGLLGALLVAVGVVLLIACTNLANLAVARGSARRQEFAVRIALGASRWRLVREPLLETGLVVLAGGVASLAVTRVILTMLSGDVSIAGSGATMLLEPEVDAAVLAAALAATLLALAVSGLGPALLSSRTNLRGALASDNAGGIPRWRGRRYLITAQVTASVVLLSIAALAVQELGRQQAQDSGLDLDRLALAEVRFEMQGYESARARQVLDAAHAIVAKAPGVSRVAIASGLPAVLSVPRAEMTLPDQAGRRWFPSLVAATSSLFETIGAQMLNGRAWTDADPIGSAGVVVLGERAAHALFGASNVVGRVVTVSPYGSEAPPDVLTIIGVAADPKVVPGRESDDLTIYTPLSHVPIRSAMLIVRATSDPEPQVPVIRRAFATVDPYLAIQQAGTATYLAGSTTLFFTVVAGVASLLGTFAWALALGGLYGVLSHIVQRRTREIGLRVALGARRDQITRLVLRDGLSPIVLGVIGGLTLGVIARVTLRPELQRLVPAVDLAMFMLVPLLFLAAGWLACYLPARRAAGVDPNVALRDL